MPVAFVLINVELGHEDAVREAFLKIEGVKEAYRIYGIYDQIVRVETKTDMGEVLTKIRHQPHVRSTLTMIVIE